MLTSFDMSNRYIMNECHSIVKFNESEIISILYYHGKHKSYYIKRFNIKTLVLMKNFKYIPDERGTKLILLSMVSKPIFTFNYKNKNGIKTAGKINVEEFI